MTTVVGITKEIKDQEGRVSMQPEGVVELVHHDNLVAVRSGADEGSQSLHTSLEWVLG